MKFTLDRVLDPAAHAPTISCISTIASVDVVDEHTVRIHTKGPALATRGLRQANAIGGGRMPTLLERDDLKLNRAATPSPSPREGQDRGGG